MPLVPPHVDYLEPFAGGASVFFLKSPVKTNTINDLDDDLINCYVQIRDNVDELVTLTTSWPISKDYHSHIKDVYRPQDDLQRAARFFYLNRTSYAGITVLYNCFWGRPARPTNFKWWAKRLVEASDKLQGVSLTCVDFDKVVDAAPDGAFLYIDPPYLGSNHSKYYLHRFDDKAHARLAQCLYRHRHRLQMLLTYDDHDLIRQLYRWMPFARAVPRRNRMARSDYSVPRLGVSERRESHGSDLIMSNSQPLEP